MTEKNWPDRSTPKQWELWQMEKHIEGHTEKEQTGEPTKEEIVRQVLETQDRIEGALRSATYLEDMLHVWSYNIGWRELSAIVQKLREVKHWIEDAIDVVELHNDDE